MTFLEDHFHFFTGDAISQVECFLIHGARNPIKPANGTWSKRPEGLFFILRRVIIIVVFDFDKLAVGGD
jgi:hypothetical protein